MIVRELPDKPATLKLAADIAALARPGDVIALRGELGVGKTTFARAFIRARGGDEAVPSPTFTLVQVYELRGGVIAAGHACIRRSDFRDHRLDRVVGGDLNCHAIDRERASTHRQARIE